MSDFQMSYNEKNVCGSTLYNFQMEKHAIMGFVCIKFISDFNFFFGNGWSELSL